MFEAIDRSLPTVFYAYICGRYHWHNKHFVRSDVRCLVLTLLELLSRFGDTLLKFQVTCPQLSPKTRLRS